MVKKVLSILTWILTAIAIIALFVFSRNSYLNTPLRSIAITIERNHEKGFLDRDHMIAELVTICDTTQRTAVGKINMVKVEKMLIDNPWIESAASFIDIDSRLLVNAKEYEPVLRVFNHEGQSVYITQEGYILPTCPSYTPRVLIASGHFRFDIPQKAKARITDSIYNESRLTEAFYICQAIENDTLMKSCIGQLYYNVNHEFELIINGLEAKILFGNAENAADKLLRLKLFLKQKGQSEELSKIKTLNLKYKNQLVCTVK